MINIVCTFDNNYAEHCAVMLNSLFANNQTEDFEIFILYENLDDKVVQRFNASCRDKSIQANLTFIKIAADVLGNVPITHHISIATYFRLFIPNVLPPRIKKVIFLDADMIIRNSLKELWETELGEYYFAATIAAGMDNYPSEIGLDNKDLYFNAGMMLLNVEKLRGFDLINKSKYLIENEPHRIKWWDQDVLNIIFNNHWLPLNLKWNSQPFVFKGELNKNDVPLYTKYINNGYTDALSSPNIVHFAGGNKPWMTKYNVAYSDEYIKYKLKTKWKYNSVFPILRRFIKKNFFSTNVK